MVQKKHSNSLKNLKPFEKGHPPTLGCGRPKGATTITAALRTLLRADAGRLPLQGEIKEITKKCGLVSVADVLALRMILLSFSKNPSASLSAIKEAMDRIEGQAKQNIAITQKVNDATKLTEKQLRDIYEGKTDFATILESTEGSSGDSSQSEEE